MSRALVFTRTTDYRHESIEHGVTVVRDLLGELGVDADHTEDGTVFTPITLAGYRLVVWLSTSGDVLTAAQRAALRRWLEDGGAWAGVHAASTAEPGWPEFERIAGARFADHPEVQDAIVHVTGPEHLSTAGLPARWEHTDEWYNFTSHPASDRTVLLTVDEGTYSGGTMGERHPLAWYGPYGDGRTWYTALGHATETYDDPRFRAHLRGGLASLLSDDAVAKA